MIEHLKGRLVEFSPAHAIIECNGVGYYCHITLNTFSKLGNSEQVTLKTHLVIREDAHSLYGFYDENERTMFRLLISVSGVGASTGRMILSALSPGELAAAIDSENVDVLKSIKGIGTKSAQRIIIDLKDKVQNAGDSVDVPPTNIGVSDVPLCRPIQLNLPAFPLGPRKIRCVDVGWG